MPLHLATIRRLDFSSLHLFVAVCECGSIGRAAQQEYMAASAVSKRLSDLEALFHTPLLQRLPRGVAPTAAGLCLLHHARAMIQQLHHMHSELDEYAEGVRGHVRVHASISATLQFLPEDLGSFSQIHSHIKIDLQEQLSVQVLQAVQNGQADVGIGSFIHGFSNLQTQPYRQDQLAVVMPRQHALAQRSTLLFSDTLHEDHVGLHDDSSVLQAMQHAAQMAGLPIRLRMQVSGLDAMCRMIANGLGLGVMPYRAFELMGATHGLVAVPLEDTWAKRQLWLVAQDFARLPHPAKLLCEHLLKHSSTSYPPSTQST